MESFLMLWIGVAVVVLIILIALLILWGKKRGEDKKVSFDKAEEEPKELTQQQKSGNYQAQSGFNFAPAQSAEPVPARETPKPPQDAAVPPVVPPIPQPQEAADEKEPAQEQPAQEQAVQEPAVSEEPAQQEPAQQEPAQQEPADVKPAELEPEPVEAEVAETVEPEADEEPTAPAEPAEPATVAPAVEEEDSPIFDEVAEDLEAEDIKEEVTEHEEAQQAAEAAEAQADSAVAALEETPVPEEPATTPEPTEPVEEIEPAGGRLGRLRGRLSRSQNAIGQGLMGILSAGDLDEDAWEEIEDTLIMADLGTAVTMKVSESLRDKIAERGVSSEAEARAMLRETLIEVGRPEMDRSIKAMPHEGKTAVIMVVGVNGTGKTTTTGKLARVLVSMGHSVLLGAADTFRAAAADQLETWGRRVGASTVRGKEGADPASVAFDAEIGRASCRERGWSAGVES